MDDARCPPGYEFAGNLPVADSGRAWVLAAHLWGGLLVRVVPGRTVPDRRRRGGVRVEADGHTAYRRRR